MSNFVKRYPSFCPNCGTLNTKVVKEDLYGHISHIYSLCNYCGYLFRDDMGSDHYFGYNDGATTYGVTGVELMDEVDEFIQSYTQTGEIE